MERFDYLYMAVSLGGKTQKEIVGTGASQDLPAKCIMLVPNEDGFTPSSIKETGDVEVMVNGAIDYTKYKSAIIPTTSLVSGAHDVYLTKITMPLNHKCLAICL
jgi:hypothetical protein